MFGRYKLIQVLGELGVGFEVVSDVVRINAGMHDKVSSDSHGSVVFVFDHKHELVRVEIKP